MRNYKKSVMAAALAGVCGFAGAVTVPAYPGSTQTWSISGAGVPAAVLNEYVAQYQTNCIDKSQRTLNMLENSTGLNDSSARKADAMASHEICARTTFQGLAVAANQAKAAALMTQGNACMSQQQIVLADLMAKEKAILVSDPGWESRVNALRGQQKAALQTLFNCKADLVSATALSSSASTEIQAAATAADQCLATYSTATAALPLPVTPPLVGVAQMTRMKSMPKLSAEDLKKAADTGSRKMALATTLRSCMRPATQKLLDVAAYAAPAATAEVATIAYVSRPAAAGAEPTLLALSSPSFNVTPDTKKYCMPGKSLNAGGICLPTATPQVPTPPAGGQCTPDAATGLCLYACPAFIYLHNGSVKAALSTDKPQYPSPNGSPHCLYVHQAGDRSAGTFDRVAGKAVDWFPLYEEGMSYGQIPRVYGIRFTGRYVPVYSDNLTIQGAYCSNRNNPSEYGYSPGTCYNSGSGGFGDMCMIDTDPSSELGKAARLHGMTRVFGGGQAKWGNFGARVPAYNGNADGHIDGAPVTGYFTQGFGQDRYSVYGTAVPQYYPGTTVRCSYTYSQYANWGPITVLEDPNAPQYWN